MRNDKYRPVSLVESRNPFTCGLTGRTLSYATLFQNTEFLARALSKRTGWQPNEGVAWDKVVGIFSLNAVGFLPLASLKNALVTNHDEQIDYIPLAYATHRLNGIASLANAAYSIPELTHQLKSSSVQVLFTCRPLLATALAAADAVNLPRSRIFLIPLVGDEKVSPPPGISSFSEFPTINDLLTEGRSQPGLEALRWTKGQARRQPAFLCYSSGTSGLPKAVMISHYNIIANSLQQTTYESVGRKSLGIKTQVELGLLPMSHIYSLIVICHTATLRGDEIIILPRFELPTFLAAIQRFRISCLPVVPPVIVRLLQEKETAKKYDLSSVRFIYSGAAPLGKETISDLLAAYPGWTLGQGYGMTESAVGICSTSEHDILHMSSGSLLPLVKAKLYDPETGKEITELDKPGELLINSPSVVLGYLHNEKANMETFVFDEEGERWLRTGDEVLFTKNPKSGHVHLVVVDRIKELIKVKVRLSQPIPPGLYPTGKERRAG